MKKDSVKPVESKPFDKTRIYLVAAIRRIWRWTKRRREVLTQAKCCYICKIQSKKYQVDHIFPVGAAPRTWDGWDGYLKRMFDGPLGAICERCHGSKTKAENALRRAKAKEA